MSELATRGVAAGYEHFKAPSTRFLESQKTRLRNPLEVERIVKPVLAEEVDAIKKKNQQDMYLLPGTGFQVRTQVDLLLENHKNGVPLSDSLQQVEQDLQGFKTEYLLELPVFPIVLEKQEYEGKTRLVGALYGGKPFADAISSDERDGVVKKSTEKIEETLLTAEPGTMVIMTSPAGWSGYQTKDNKLEPLNPYDIKMGNAEEIEYPDSQTYCFQVQKDGSIRGFTLKTDMTLSQNKQLLKNLGVPEDAFQSVVDNRADIKRVVESVVVIDPKEDESIEDIAQNIQHIKGGEVAYKDSADRSRTFAEMMDLLQNPDSLWTLDATVKSYIDPLKAYISQRITDSDEETRGDLETAMGLTALKLMHEIRPPKQKKKVMWRGARYDIEDRIVSPFDAQDTLEEMRKIAGCAGGGKKKNILNSITPRTGFNKDDDEQEWFSCPKCGYRASGPIGNGPCPNPECRLTQEQAAEEGYIVCD